jgi:hypothetical protein
MENMDKGLTVPKWVLFSPKYSKCPQIYLPKLFFSSPKVLDLNKKGLNLASVVRVFKEKGVCHKILLIFSKKGLN